MFSVFKFCLAYFFFISIKLTYNTFKDKKHDKYATLIKKYYPNSKYLTSGTFQVVYINNNRIIKVYDQTNFNYVILLRKLDIYPPIYKIIKDNNYYIVKEKYLKPIPNCIFILEKYGNNIFKKFKISFGDIKNTNYGIDPDTNKIHRFDCSKKDIFLKKKNIALNFTHFCILVYLTFLLIIFTFTHYIYFYLENILYYKI